MRPPKLEAFALSVGVYLAILVELTLGEFLGSYTSPWVLAGTAIVFLVGWVGISQQPRLPLRIVSSRWFLMIIGFVLLIMGVLAGLQLYRGVDGGSDPAEYFEFLLLLVAGFLVVATLYRRASKLAIQESTIESWSIGPVPRRSLLMKFPFLGIVFFFALVGSNTMSPVLAGIVVAVALSLAAVLMRLKRRDDRTLVLTDDGIVVQTEGHQVSGFMPWWRIRGVTLGDSFLKIRDLVFVDSIRIKCSMLNDPESVATSIREYVSR